MNIFKIAFICFLLFGCAQSSSKKNVTIYTFEYSPYIENSDKGMIIELVRAAYKSQGISVNFNIDTLENSYLNAKKNSGIMLGSREYRFEQNQKSIYEEFYNVETYMISIKGNKSTGKMGVFSSDEIEYAKSRNLEPVKYITPEDGIFLLGSGKVDSIICTDISCDQIKITNPGVEFSIDFSYQFPIDLVYFGESMPDDCARNIESLKKGLNFILENGKYLEIQNRYRIKNPLFQIPFESLNHIKVEN